MDKYSDSEKARLLYQHANSDALPEHILQPGNERQNAEMAILCLLSDGLLGCWDTKYLLEGQTSNSKKVISTYATIEGYRIAQAIIAEGKKSLRAEAEEKKGLLSKFSGDKK